MSRSDGHLPLTPSSVDVESTAAGSITSLEETHDTLCCAVKYFSPATSTVIIRVSREHYRTLWAALTLLRKVGGHECIARVVHVSGEKAVPFKRDCGDVPRASGS